MTKENTTTTANEELTIFVDLDIEAPLCTDSWEPDEGPIESDICIYCDLV
jgi:hypothetical protein